MGGFGGLGLLVRAEVRRRWLALVLVGLLAGVVGAATVTAVAGARRSATAYDRLAEQTGQPDATVVGFVGGDLIRDVAELPQVDEAWRFRGVVGQMLDVPAVVYLSVTTGPPRPPGLFQPRVETGRLAAEDAADEVAVDAGLAAELDVAVGDHLPLALLTQEEVADFDVGFGHPDGPEVDLEVVGTFSVAGNDTSEAIGLLTSSAFDELARGAGGGDGAMVRLDDDPDAVDAFAAGVLELAEDYDLPPDAEELGAYDLRLAREDRQRSNDSAGVVANGLLLVGAVGLVIGALGVGQTVLRHQTRGLGTRPVLSALGLERRARVVGSVLPFVAVSAPVVAVVTVAGAVALSPLLPIGVSRRLEPSPGVEVNVAVLGLGALAAVLLFLAVTTLVVARMVRRPRAPRPDHPTNLGRGIRSGLPYPVTVGAGLALEGGRGGAVVPVRAAMAGGVLAVAAVVAATSFAGSLDRLVETPARYGSPGDVIYVDARDDVVQGLVDDPDVAAVLEVRGFDLVIEGVARDAFSSEVVKGSIGFNYLEGRPPTGPAEIALGPALADRLDVDLGDTVMVDGMGGEATVVGVVLTRGDTGNAYAEGVVVDEEIRAAATASGFREVIIRYADGVDVEAEADALGVDNEIEQIIPPIRIRDLDQVRNLPLILAAGAGLLGVVLLTHALVVTVRRRGRDLALLRALGARPRQVATSVVVMTVVIVVIGVALGIPAGLLVGNLAWRALAGTLYVADDLAAPVRVAVACLPVALAVGLVAAAVPTRRASRLEVAEQLRRE